MFGKGWTNGSQAHLEFLPERDTDFIFAVHGRGIRPARRTDADSACTSLSSAAACILPIQAHGTYSRLLAGSISLTFFVYVFVNTAMVTGLVPVVGVPLPLVSFGGTSMVTLMAGFGILMSIHSTQEIAAALMNFSYLRCSRCNFHAAPYASRLPQMLCRTRCRALRS